MPNASWFADLVHLADSNMNTLSPYLTSHHGIFSVGNVRASSVKRVASPVSEGAVVISCVWTHVSGTS
jgi:thioredoxin reductase (NADPH)